ncbi:MAG: NAD(P)-dependent oxidoreductase, partial [Betaproteobacteria bacterium]|nr:NAD(P)-dependent oxidoreductase [Betaproteobacteria bacterium]
AVLPGIAARMDTLIAEGEGMKDAAVLAKDAVSR